mgnify:CR=1 FL=1
MLYKKSALIFLCFVGVSCAELQQVVNELPNGTLTNADIASGLRQALDKGIKAAKPGGYVHDISSAIEKCITKKGYNYKNIQHQRTRHANSSVLFLDTRGNS